MGRTWTALLALALLAQPAWAGKKKKKKEAPAPAPAAAPGGKVQLPCDWPAGTTFTYVQGRQRTDARRPELDGVTSASPVTITVTASGDPLSLEWLVGKPELSGPPEALAAIGPISEEVPQVPMQLKMTDGTLTEVTNQQALVDAIEPLLRKMAEGGPPEALEQTLAMMRDPDAGNRMLLQDPGRFFSMHCAGMTEGQVVESPVEYPNPFGGPPLAGTSKVTMVGHDPQAGTVTYETLDQLSPETVTALTTSLLERFAPGTDPALVEQILAQLPPVESVTRGRMVYAVADGFPVTIEVHQDVGAEEHPLHRSDSWTWTRQPSP